MLVVYLLFVLSSSNVFGSAPAVAAVAFIFGFPKTEKGFVKSSALMTNSSGFRSTFSAFPRLPSSVLLLMTVSLLPSLKWK